MIKRLLGCAALALILGALAHAWLAQAQGRALEPGLTLTLTVQGRPRTAGSGSGQVSGVVVDTAGPVSGASVRQRATDKVTSTAADGQFTLGSLSEGHQIELAAWADGYYVASTFVTPTLSGVTLTLRPYHTADHPDYTWSSPISGTSPVACGNCHPMIVSQWITNAHGGAVSNPRFYSLYNGTDAGGTVQISPGYLEDFPGTAGACANCHAPGAGIDGYLTTSMNDVRGQITAGIHCDYCHKVGGVYLDPATQSVYANTPGAQSQRMLRPPPGDNIFFGPYDDVHDPDTYLPAISESAFCAPCHQFSFWGTPIYESYDEWLASPYAQAGVTCQACHMPPTGDTRFALPEVGGLEHPPERIPSHLQRGASDEALLRSTVSMTVAARQTTDALQLSVAITNTAAGHHVPTDFPGRHMILALSVVDEKGQELTLAQGSTVPEWGGTLAGLPGKAFAKLLRDAQSGQQPVVSYWKQTLLVSDNRIPARQCDTSTYRFVTPRITEPLTITAKLVFRRVFQHTLDARGWDTPDVLMGEHTLIIQPQTWRDLYLPLIVD